MSKEYWCVHLTADGYRGKVYTVNPETGAEQLVYKTLPRCDKRDATADLEYWLMVNRGIRSVHKRESSK